MDPLPGIEWTWDEYAEVLDFVQYNVYRRERRSVLDEQETLAMQMTGSPAERWQLPTADVLSGIRGAVAMRVTIDADDASGVYLDYQEDASHLLRLTRQSGSTRFRATRVTGAGTTNVDLSRAVTPGETVTVVLAWDEDTLYVSIDGDPFTSGASVAGIALDIDAIDLATQQGIDPASVTIHWVTTFADVPTAAHLATLAELPDDVAAPVQLEDVAAAYPTAVWNGDDTEGAKVVIDDWLLIAELDEVTRPLYGDYAVASGREYEYTTTVTVNAYGELLESDKQDPPLSDSCTFTGIVVQDATDQAQYVRLNHSQITVEPGLEVEYGQASGRTRPTAFVGEFEASRIAIVPLPHLLDEPTEWSQLRRLFGRQRSAAATYLIRNGNAPERWYAHLDALSRADALVLGQTSIAFAETHFQESAG